MKISSKRKEIITGITLELTNDEATHLSMALTDAQQRRRPNGWPWLDKFKLELDTQRGVGGGTFGRTPLKGV